MEVQLVPMKVGKMAQNSVRKSVDWKEIGKVDWMDFDWVVEMVLESVGWKGYK